ncbi:transglutaminase domain-containing protein [Salinivirga cyanobacteriivorans]
MKTLLTLLLMSYASMAFTQNIEKKFGEISREELTMTSYSKAPDAPGVVLFDMGSSEFIEPQGNNDIRLTRHKSLKVFDADVKYIIRFTRHKRLKIFDSAALDQAKITIPYYVDGYGSTEYVRDIEAITYNTEIGRLVRQELIPGNVKTEKIDSHWYQKTFEFPNAQVGSVLEYTYVLETPFLFNLPDWSFQSRLPTIYSEYKARMVPFYEYVFLAQGIERFDVRESYTTNNTRSWGEVSKVYGKNVESGIEFKENVYTYAMKGVPAFKDEAYITSINDYLMKMDFQLARFHSPAGGSYDIISTWPELIQILEDHSDFGKYANRAGRFAKRLSVLDTPVENKNESQLAQTIINYAKQNFTWNGISSKYASQSARSFYKSKNGNSADINLFLCAMLKEAGIDAEPVIISTRDHGKVDSQYPFGHFFNYTVLVVKTDNPFLADATEATLPYDRIPPRCMNGKGLVIDINAVKWVQLNQQVAAQKEVNLFLTPDPLKKKMTVNMAMHLTEFDAYEYRRKYKNVLKIEKEFSKVVDDVVNVAIDNWAQYSKPLGIRIEGAMKIQGEGGVFKINPFMNLALRENQLRQRERKYPVDFIYPKSRLFHINLNIPDGYKLKNVPGNYEMDNSLATIMLKYHKQGNVLKIEGQYSLKKAVYSPDEYSRIRAYLRRIVEKFNGELVFVKD